MPRKKKNSLKKNQQVANVQTVNVATVNEEPQDSADAGKNNSYKEIIGTLVASKFRLIKLLGSGSYGKFTYITQI